jgi:hypothetical protein
MIRFLATFVFVLAAACSGNSDVDPITARLDRIFQGNPGFGTIDRARVRRMMEVPSDEDTPFFMVNYIRHREFAEYPDGRESDLTGAQADQLYGAGILSILLDIGARPVFVANVETSLQSTDGIVWDQIGVVLYPSREDFFSMLEREDFRAIVDHKRAGIEETLVMIAEMSGEEFSEAFRTLDVASVPMPPTAEDRPLAIVHLYSYREKAVYADGRETDLTGREAVNLYTANRGEQGVLELGVRPSLWLEIDGGIIEDESVWHEFRVNLFPSHATFWNVASSAGDAGIEHRTAGLAELYTLITAPILNEYGYE